VYIITYEGDSVVAHSRVGKGGQMAKSVPK